MRIGHESPFLFVWAFNTTDAVILSWCAIIKRDRAYTVLNVFWIGVGIVGMMRASGFAHTYAGGSAGSIIYGENMQCFEVRSPSWE